ncbi:MAG TPA: 5-dehydro-4-deoxy-D-glucuronate isomerase [Kiritimatiellia bacterium]|nr:5-dehydro-4-deoxy-D-glucuronate isomerase [Kiritimatiellia bacterium]
MKMRISTDPAGVARMDTNELRDAFLVDDLFAADAIAWTYWDVDRTLVGSAVPVKAPLRLGAAPELRAEFFCARREIGVLNVGAPGRITVDGTAFDMANLDGLYIGRGAKEIEFASADPNAPARFYLLSYPAHAAHPTTHIKLEQAAPVHLGSPAECNKRTIYKYIHPDGVKSCQLVMGFTKLAEGSIWNTMPPHTHDRRSEVYLYFNLAPNARVFHFMGKPDATRHLVVANEQAALSPSWSIHCGAGTGAYTFCWGMGGENQDFADMDGIKMDVLR